MLLLGTEIEKYETSNLRASVIDLISDMLKISSTKMFDEQIEKGLVLRRVTRLKKKNLSISASTLPIFNNLVYFLPIVFP